MNSYGKCIKMSIFGQSHSPAIGMTLEGVPAGFEIDMQELGEFLSRRAPGKNDYSTARKEADLPEFIAGVKNNITCGAPITALIRNTDTKSKDYSELKIKPRPGHADITAEIKYGGFQDFAGGGHFSGRLTAPMCIAGGICKQILKSVGIEIISRIVSIGGVKDSSPLVASTAEKAFPTADDAAGERMIARIAEAKAQGESVGGVIECAVLNVPAGVGDPMFDGMENRIASIVFGIPAVKGVEFGSGFAAAEMTGSENNDEIILENGEISFASNNSGGILGGITNGMPIVFRAAVKPTPSIGLEQNTVDITKMNPAKLAVNGRHDPCIVPRAVPVMEAAAAIAVYDALLEHKKHI